MRYGAPTKLIKDCAKYFISEELRTVYNHYNIEHATSIGYKPTTVGQTERNNRTLEEMLTHYAGVDHDEWDTKLNNVVLAYNTTVHDVTKMTPYYLVMSYEYRSPLNRQLKTPLPLSKERAANRARRVKTARRKARKLILEGQAKVAARYNKNRRDLHLKVGDVVYARNNLLPEWGLTNKFLMKYLGPFKVVQICKDNNYVIETTSTPIVQEIVHISMIKKTNNDIIGNGDIEDLFKVPDSDVSKASRIDDRGVRRSTRIKRK